MRLLFSKAKPLFRVLLGDFPGMGGKGGGTVWGRPKKTYWFDGFINPKANHLRMYEISEKMEKKTTNLKTGFLAGFFAINSMMMYSTLVDLLQLIGKFGKQPRPLMDNGDVSWIFVG